MQALEDYYLEGRMIIESKIMLVSVVYVQATTMKSSS